MQFAPNFFGNSYAPEYYGGCEASSTPEVDVASAALAPKQATVDGVTVTNHDLNSLIAAAEYLAKRKAACKPGGGVKFSKIISGGTVSQR